MSIIDVAIAGGEARSYPVVVERDARSALAERLASLAPTKIAVVTDENVARVELAPLRAALARAKLDIARIEAIPPGERSKTLATVERVYRAFEEAALDRRAVVVALGGGVAGDVAGFAAATFLRGIAIVHAPTSLVAMVDAAIGGKTGVNLGGKNIVGAFHQPAGVFASVASLATLPDAELRSGLGEALKTALLAGEELLARLERDAERLARKEEAALVPVIEACARLKASIVARDERETGDRALLNLGHTLGHALEALDGFGRLRHGEAVAIGCVFAARLAVRLGRARAELAARVEAAAKRLGLPVRASGPIAPGRVLEMMRKDKKSRGGKIRYVLPLDVGRAEVQGDVPEDAIADELAAFVAR